MLSPVLVGRDAELHTLVAALDSAEAGEGRALFLTGDPGVGKSRLAAELSSVAAERGFTSYRGRAVQSASPAALQARDRGTHADGQERAPGRGGRRVGVPRRPGRARSRSRAARTSRAPRPRHGQDRGQPADCRRGRAQDARADREGLAPDPRGPALGRPGDARDGRLPGRQPRGAAGPAGRHASRRRAVGRPGHRQVDRGQALGRADRGPATERTRDRGDGRRLPGRGSGHGGGGERRCSPTATVSRSRSRRSWPPPSPPASWCAGSTAGTSRDGVSTAVPDSIVGSVLHRLAALGPDVAEVIVTAAVLGRQFDWTLLPAICEVSDEAVIAALRQGPRRPARRAARGRPRLAQVPARADQGRDHFRPLAARPDASVCRRR